VNDVDGLDEAAALLGREIDLRRVAGDHRPRIEAEARQKHLHLLARRILRLVEDDERVVESTPAHEGQGSHFDHAPIHQPGRLLERHHVVEGIVERP
jgi:hypothetical protein